VIAGTSQPGGPQNLLKMVGQVIAIQIQRCGRAIAENNVSISFRLELDGVELPLIEERSPFAEASIVLDRIAVLGSAGALHHTAGIRVLNLDIVVSRNCAGQSSLGDNGACKIDNRSEGSVSARGCCLIPGIGAELASTRARSSDGRFFCTTEAALSANLPRCIDVVLGLTQGAGLIGNARHSMITILAVADIVVEVGTAARSRGRNSIAAAAAIGRVDTGVVNAAAGHSGLGAVVPARTGSAIGLLNADSSGHIYQRLTSVFLM
jgi:hypothetical protein